MHQITIVTSNAGKVRELETIASGKLSFTMHVLDIDEIQSLDLVAIVTHKAKEAFAQINGPVIVDDVSAGLDSLNGLPGPFIRYFNSALGEDSLCQLSKAEHDRVTISCVAAYYDGQTLLIGEGIVHGNLVAPRGEHGFGFDPVVELDGGSLTMAEMTTEQKMKVSHRSKAFKSLLSQISDHLAR